MIKENPELTNDIRTSGCLGAEEAHAAYCAAARRACSRSCAGMNNPADIYQRDDGLWSIGSGDDAPGPFESRQFAMSVAGYLPPEPAIPFRKINYRRAHSARSYP